MTLYLVIECGYEGIQDIIFPTHDAKEAVDKILSIRNRIAELQKRRIEVLKKFGKDEDEHFNDAWDRMGLPVKSGGTREITSEEWQLGKYGNPDAYCIKKWDGNKFECVCKELKVEPSETWLY